MDRGRGARSTVDRRWRGPKTLEHGGVLTGLWPAAISGARKLTGGGTTERGEHGELGSGLTGDRAAVWQPGDVGEMVEEGELGDSGTCPSGEGEE
jgi:hypothetical protein